VAVLSPASNLIGLSADYLTILVDKAEVILPQHIGINTFTLTISDVDFPSFVTPLTIPILVEV